MHSIFYNMKCKQSNSAAVLRWMCWGRRVLPREHAGLVRKRWPISFGCPLMCDIPDSFILPHREWSLWETWLRPQPLLAHSAYHCDGTFAWDTVLFLCNQQHAFLFPQDASILPWLWTAWYIHLCWHCKFSAMLPWFILNLMFWSNYFDIKPVSSVKAETTSVVISRAFLASCLVHRRGSINIWLFLFKFVLKHGFLLQRLYGFIFRKYYFYRELRLLKAIRNAVRITLSSIYFSQLY